MRQPPKEGNIIINIAITTYIVTTTWQPCAKHLTSTINSGVRSRCSFCLHCLYPFPNSLWGPPCPHCVAWIEWKLQEDKDFCFFSSLLDLRELEQCLPPSNCSVNEWLNQSILNRVANVRAKLPGKGEP